jgi:Protein of unknown function (DUF1659).
MAVIVNRNATRLQLSVQTGINTNGDPVLKTMTMNKIKLAAADQDLFDVALEVQKLLAYPVAKVEKIESSYLGQA